MVKPNPIGQVQQFDVSQPLNAYHQAQQNRRAEESHLANQQMQQMQLDQYKQDAPMRDFERNYEMKMKRLTMDQNFLKYGQSLIVGIDPDAEDFDQQVVDRAVNFERDLVERFGLSPQEAGTMVNNVMKSGVTTRENIRKQQMSMGLRDKPKQKKAQIVGDQVVTFDETGGIAQDIQGLRPKTPESVKPTDIDDYRDLMRDEYRANNGGKDPSPGWLARRMLEFKRAQSDEISENTAAKLQTEAQWKPIVAYNVELQKKLVEVETLPKKLKAEGKITDEEKKVNAQSRLSGLVARMAGQYLKLDSMGGIVNVDKSSMENIEAAIKSSQSGQFVSRIVGSKPQAIRDMIRNAKPLLTNYIRQASEMGARGMDSEKELEFYRSAASDEKKDLQSNLAALIVLDEKYGNGELKNKLGERQDVLNAINDLQMEFSGEYSQPQPIQQELSSMTTQGPPTGAAFGGVNPATGQMEYFDAQGNKL